MTFCVAPTLLSALPAASTMPLSPPPFTPTDTVPLLAWPVTSNVKGPAPLPARFDAASEPDPVEDSANEAVDTPATASLNETEKRSVAAFVGETVPEARVTPAVVGATISAATMKEETRLSVRKHIHTTRRRQKW
jgi:hypothetical protein